MFTITKRAKVVEGSEPVDKRIGTFLKIEILAGGPLEFGFSNGSRPRSATETMTIDWDDGTVESATTLSNVVHGYSRPGAYTVYIDDNLWRFAVSGMDEESVWRRTYAPMVRELRSNATHLTTLNQYAFAGATALRKVDLSSSAVSSLNAHTFDGCTALASFSAMPEKYHLLGDGVFRNCSALSGRMYFPGVATISDNAQWDLPFAGCSASEIHFAAKNESEIKSTPTYRAHPDLGASNAEMLFDL